MSIPVFDIVQDDLTSVEWLECQLIIEMNPHYFYYTLLNGKNDVVALKYFQIAYNNNQEMVNLLEEIVSEDVLLREKIKSCLIVFNWPENCLAPLKYFDKELNKDILGLLFGFLDKGLILSEKIPGADIYVIYSLPPALDHFFQQRFPDCTYRHYYSLWLNCTLKEEKNIRDHVRVIFNSKEIIAAVFIGGQLQVIQNLPYQTSEDIAWQLLNIYHQFNLEPEVTPLFVGGMIDKNSAMYEELLKYFQWVETDNLPAGPGLPPQFQSFPEHFFSPFLKLAQCVS